MHSPPELAPTVYRNAQGVVQPAITDSDEPCYWRIQPARRDSKETRHSHGDLVWLSWSFADQPSGFRDFSGDSYGRRSFQCPAECGKFDTLCLKVPYPRFENPGDDGIALVMSTAMTEEAVVQPLPIRPIDGEGPRVERTYNLHDLCFRLDHVGNGGEGDAADFMSVVTDAHTKAAVITLSKCRYREARPFNEGSPEAVVAGMVLGPLAAPALSVVGSVVSGIFDLF